MDRLCALRWWPRGRRRQSRCPIEPLRFEEVARNGNHRPAPADLSADKSLLTVFGPIGNVAARTGRGLNLTSRLEPYVPHHLGGFILFSLAAFAGAVFLAVRSGEPAAMIGAAGLLQIGCGRGQCGVVVALSPVAGGGRCAKMTTTRIRQRSSAGSPG